MMMLIIKTGTIFWFQFPDVNQTHFTYFPPFHLSPLYFSSSSLFCSCSLPDIKFDGNKQLSTGKILTLPCFQLWNSLQPYLIILNVWLINYCFVLLFFRLVDKHSLEIGFWLKFHWAINKLTLHRNRTNYKINPRLEWVLISYTQSSLILRVYICMCNVREGKIIHEMHLWIPLITLFD